MRSIFTINKALVFRLMFLASTVWIITGFFGGFSTLYGQQTPAGYIYETFNTTNNDQLPAGWSSGDPYTFHVRTAGGVNDSRKLTRRFTVDQQNGFWQTPEFEMGPEPMLSFFYRVVNATNPLTATPETRFRLNFSISTNGGETFTVFHQIGRTMNNHVESVEYVQVVLPEILAQWAGMQAIIKMQVAYHGGSAGDYWVDFDNVIIGSFYNANFLVTNGEVALSGATVSVPGKPYLSATTNAAGEATLLLPAGEHNYRVTATGYLTYESALTVSDTDINVPEIALIGNFTRTFTLRDQNNSPLSGVAISYTGTAQSYQGPVEVNGSITTNSSGTGARILANGAYSFTAAKTKYYPYSGGFTMNNAPSAETIQLQVFPQVTFTILGEADGAEDIPLQDAKIEIEGFPPLTTNAVGQVSDSIPIGSWSYTVSRIGYITESFNFEVETNDNISLPAVVLQIRPTAFALVSPAGGELHFRKTSVGQSSPQLSVVFSNHGSGLMEIGTDDITLAGPDAASFTLINLAAPVSLATGQEATIGIRLSPLAAGVKQAQLQITDNLVDKTIHVVGLFGEAYQAPVLPFSDDFSSGDFSQWILINGEQSNQWHVGEPANSPGVLAAMVSNDGGVTNAYSINTLGIANYTSNVYFYQDFLIPAFEDGQVKLVFDWKGMGQANSDRLRVWSIDPSINPVAGSNLGTGALANLNSQIGWQHATYDLPQAHHNSVRRIVFQWQNNNDAQGAQPPAAVDNIYLGRFYQLMMASQPPAAGVFTGQGSFAAGTGVAIGVEARPGYLFQGWNAPAGVFEDASLAQTIFTLPAQDVTLSAGFVLLPPEVDDLTVSYNASVQSLTGTVTSGFDLVWYNAAEGGEPVSPAAVAAGTHTFWAAAKDADGFESERIAVNLIIEQASLEITAQDKAREYGESDPELTFAITGGELFGDDALTGVLERETGEDAGVYSILQGTLDNINYNITFIPGTLTIEPATLTVTANDKIKFFDGLPFPTEEFSVRYAGFKFDENPQVLGGTLQYGGSATGATAPGEYEIVPSGLESDNYIFAYVAGTLTITDLIILTLEGVMAEDKIFDGTTVATLNFDNAVLVGVEEGDDVDTDVSATVATFASSNAGNNIPVTFTGVILTGNDSQKYTLVKPALTANILPRMLQVTVDANQSKVLGEVDPDAYSYTLTEGSFAGDDLFSGALAREAGEQVGVYNILQGSLSAGSNYQIEFIPDVFTIFARLSLETTPADAGILTGGGLYLAGEQVSITAQASGGFMFVNWTDAQGVEVSQVTDFVWDMPGANTVLVAHFAPVTYSLSLSVMPENAGTATGAGNYEEGEQVQVSATANTGYLFKGWYEGEQQRSLDAVYAFAMPADDLHLVAVFDAENNIAEETVPGLMVYPNPVTDNLNIRSERIMQRITLTDLSGRMVYEHTAGDDYHTIKVAELRPGIYLLRIATAEGATTRKIVVK